MFNLCTGDRGAAAPSLLVAGLRYSASGFGMVRLVRSALIALLFINTCILWKARVVGSESSASCQAAESAAAKNITAIELLEWNCFAKWPRVRVPGLNTSAFHRSLFQEGDLGRLRALRRDLAGRCIGGLSPGVINVVVFGGSVTAGSQCGNGPFTIPPGDDPGVFMGSGLQFPAMDNIANSWNERCPWSRRVHHWLQGAYPGCKVDVYNLARPSTKSDWINANMHTWSWAAARARARCSRTRSTSCLYSSYAAAGEPLPADAELVAVTESVVRFLLSLPSRPVLVYVETGGLGGAAHLADITLYHARVAT